MQASVANLLPRAHTLWHPAHQERGVDRRSVQESNMPNIHLPPAGGDPDLPRPPREETVTPESIELTVINLSSPERHWRMLRHLEFDVCELSMASYMLAKDLGLARYTAIPAFPHRRMRHSFFLINAALGVRTPKDVEGKRGGLRTPQTTPTLWLRGILQDASGG